jgi:hypothetical protein
MSTQSLNFLSNDPDDHNSQVNRAFGHLIIHFRQMNVPDNEIEKFLLDLGTRIDNLDYKWVEVKTPVCIICGRFETMFVPTIGYNDWRAGANIQSALPMLSADDREMLITGTHKECWNKMGFDK